MARISVDDSVARDPRITALAMQLGRDRMWVLGHLVASVWPICYDQRTAVIVERLVDIATGIPGFGIAMVDCDLARRTRGGKLEIRGAVTRIKYLVDAEESGRVGGLKSGESRRKNARVALSNPVGSPNPIPTLIPSASAPLPERKKKNVDDADAGLAALLHGWIVKNQPTGRLAKQGASGLAKSTAIWAEDFRRMREIDKLEIPEIERVLEWSQLDSFWAANVMSAKTLRAQWDKLCAAMNRPKAARRNASPEPLTLRLDNPHPDDDMPRTTTWNWGSKPAASP